MRHVKISAFNIPDAWYQTVRKIWEIGDVFNVDYGSEVTETKKLDVTILIKNPEIRPLVDEKAPCDDRYVQMYWVQYLWLGEKLEGETYTYGSRMRHPTDQIDKAIDCYVRNLFDRQVTLVIRVPQDINKEFNGRRHEPPCLTFIDTEIMRNDDEKLHFNITGYFRSWDAYAGLPANLAGLQNWSEQFVKELNVRRLKKTGEKCEKIYTGKIITHSKNCHIYERNYSFVKDLLETKIEKTGEIVRSRDSK
jgi:thymidylate synthase